MSHVRLRRWSARVALVSAAVAAAALGLVLPASAHVKVSGIDVTQGGYGVVTFRVPSESTTASTTELLITLPSDTPFTSVGTQSKPGWTATVIRKPLPTPAAGEDSATITEYVSQVDFKANTPDATIPPGQFDVFNLSLGTFPKAPSVSFGALQTYSDGTTVNWNEKAATGAAEPAHPAPVLQVAAATSSGSSAPAATTTDRPSSGSGWAGITGLVLGIVALLVSVAAFASTRRGATSAGE